RDPAPREPKPLRDARGILAPVKRVQDRAHEAPDGVRAEADRDGQEHDLAERVAGDEQQAPRLIGRGAADAGRQAEGKESHHAIEHAADDVSDALQELEGWVRSGAASGRTRSCGY